MQKLSPMPWKTADGFGKAELIQDANGRDLVMRLDHATLDDMRMMTAARELYRAVLVATDFVEGFECDESQQGISEILAQLRSAASKAEGKLNTSTNSKTVEA